MSSKLLQNKFFSFLKPFLGFVDSPKFFTKPFSWLYYLFAAVYLLSPFYALYKIIGTGFFEYAEANEIAAGILTLIAFFIGAWLGFQVWLNRRLESESEKVTGALVIDVLTNLVYTAFEASCIFIAVAGTLSGVFTAIFGGGILEIFVYDVASLGIFAAVICLIGGYIGVLISKFIALLFRKILEIIFYVAVRIFRFAVHVIKQLFEYFFIFIQSGVDFTVNGWRVVVALVAKLGNFLLDFAKSKKQKTDSVSITYNT